VQNVSSFGGSTWAAFNIKFCFPFLSHSSSTFLGYLSTGHTLKDLDFSVFLSHSSSHSSSSSSCVITTHRHSKEFKFIFFPSFLCPSVFCARWWTILVFLFVGRCFAFFSSWWRLSTFFLAFYSFFPSSSVKKAFLFGLCVRVCLT